MDSSREPPDETRWPALFRFSREPIFILNQHRRIVFANAAFEVLTKVNLADMRGLTCTRRETGRERAELSKTLAPPDEVLEGTTTCVRRPEPGADSGPPWYDIDFLPLLGDDGFIGLIGRIRPISAAAASGRHAVSEDLASLRKHEVDRFSMSLWEGRAPESQRIVNQIRIVATSGSPAAIIGEPGTGKHTLARTVHAIGPHREMPCVCLDAEGLPAIAIRAILTGSTGLNLADRIGLIYLHNPASLPRDLQSDVAELIGDRLQFIVGYSSDPHIDVQTGKLAEQLWATTSIIVMELQPLRKRASDLTNLVETLMRRAADGGTPPVWSAEALDLARSYTWPGNLDEMSDLADELVARCASRTVLPSDLPMAMRQPTEATRKVALPPLDRLLERVEARMIRWALDRAKGNKSKAAELLGVWRPRLLRRIESLGIDASEE